MRLVNLDKFPLLPNKLEGHLTEYERGYLDAQSNLNALPNVDAEPVRHGHWVETIENGKMKRVTSCCGDDQTKLTTWYRPDYCPNCGAKMDEEDTE